MVYQVGGQNRFKGFLANNWLDLDNTGSQHYPALVNGLQDEVSPCATSPVT